MSYIYMCNIYIYIIYYIYIYMLYFGETNSSNFTQPLQSLAGPPQEIDSNRVDRPA